MSKDSSKYDKLTQREHVLVRPDTYIGSIECTEEEHWIYDDVNNKMKKKLIKFTAGFLKIFDEILVNAADAKQNDNTCDTLEVEYNKEEGYISVLNNGDNGIPIEEHEKHKMLIPTMIFGELLTGSNFDDTAERTTGGRNGLGAKLVNIFSNRFIVEIVDGKRKKKYVQEWSENMSVVGKPEVTTLKNTKSYIKVTFYPDVARFGLKSMDNDHYNLFYRRTIDIAGMNENKLKVFFNKKKIELTNFRSYINLYYPNDEVYIDETNDRWKVGIIYKPDEGNEVVSFVNSINTYNGGTHVTHVVDNNIIKTLINDYIKKKEKDIKISPQLLKENLIFFINSTLVNPTFSSQSKDTCTLKTEKFGSKYVMHQPFIKKFAKCGIVDQVIELAKYKETTSLKKTDGKKTTTIRGIPKLDDANKAGTKDSMKCSLILTEGDSAKTTAISGLSVVGRDYFGVFPLKGKLLNTREAPPVQLMNNEEINNLKQILGLRHDVDYSIDENFNQLRYGRIVCLTDADVDGSHIKGLVINFIHSLWPSLAKRKGFITSMTTPIVKAFKGNEEKAFYNLTDYEEWIKNNNTKSWKIKYYKGLGTSTAFEAKEYFVNFEEKLISYVWKEFGIDINSDESDNEHEQETEKLPYDKNSEEDAILLAFDKNRADDRKVWLQNYDKNDVLKYEEKEISYSKFIHSDLIHFSNDDLSRSIPSLIDGLKPSQRKILYGAFLRGLDKTEVKVAQLAGFVSDKAAYHHGEASLMGAIIGMAQDYMGSNNINILKPNGQFGSRLESGKDSASPRYIWTELEKLSCIIYNQVDDPVLNHQYEDDERIEPEYYVPILPMILINGAQGIGTGFSTKVPPYNPKDTIHNLKLKLKGKPMEEMDPWWQGFEGVVVKVDDYNYEIYGAYQIKGNKLIITELPVGESTSDYRAFLKKMLEGEETKKAPTVTAKATKGKKPVAKKPVKKEKEDNPLLAIKDNSSDTKVYFELTFEDGYLDSAKDIEKQFKLVKKYSLNNMNLFNKHGTITKYNNVLDIIDEYFNVRLEYYEKRKAYQLELLEFQRKLISYKVKFILMIIEKKLVVNNKKKSELEEELEKLKFPKLGKSKNDTDLSYNYLISMPIYNLTKEKIDELKNQEEEKNIEYNTLENTTVHDMWLNELDKLEKEYNNWLKQKETVANQEPTKKPKSKKSKTV